MESFWPPASLDFGVEEYGSVRYEYMADYSYRTCGTPSAHEEEHRTASMHTTLSGKCGASDCFSSSSTLTLGGVKKIA